MTTSAINAAHLFDFQMKSNQLQELDQQIERLQGQNQVFETNLDDAVLYGFSAKLMLKLSLQQRKEWQNRNEHDLRELTEQKEQLRKEIAELQALQSMGIGRGHNFVSQSKPLRPGGQDQQQLHHGKAA